MKTTAKSVIIVLCFISGTIIAQNSQINTLGQPSLPKSDTTLCFVRKDIKLDKIYSKDQLLNLPKLQLIEIYKERIEYMIEFIPFIALHPQPGATMYDMSIPQTELNLKHLDKEIKNKQIFLSSLYSTLNDIIPYAEKSNIVWSILYIQDLIKKSDYVASRVK
jgi:hypothetical protein